MADGGEVTEVAILDRILRWTPDAYEWEADPRLAEGIIEDYEVAKEQPLYVYTCHCEKSNAKSEFDRPLDDKQRKPYRSRVHQAMFLSQDRPDIAFAAQEMARLASKPAMGNAEQMRRLAGYLKGKTRMLFKYGIFKGDSSLVGNSDTDWVGCLITRRSTSGTLIQIAKRHNRQ